MTVQRHVVDELPALEAELNYMTPMGQRPRNYTDPPQGVPASNISYDHHRVAIRDMRPIASSLKLDDIGFAVVSEASAFPADASEDEIKRLYYPQSEAILKHATGADRVHIFDHTLRRRVPGHPGGRDDGPRQPVLRVHIDHTARSGPQRVRDLLRDEADELLRGRVQVINLWRPLRGPLHDSPLAVCDARSVAAEDLVPTDLVYPHRVGETYSVLYNPGHRWFYLSGMRTDEALLIKCCDSLDEGQARFTPHTSFVNETAPPGAPPRESVEIRALVFYSA